MVYKNENNTVTELESTSFGGGRINKTSNGYSISYYITDHLGSTRAGGGGMVHYYPFGKTWENSSHPAPQTRYLFNGKEKQTIIAGFDLIDYGNRMYDDFIARWLTQDPLQEGHYNWSSYAYVYGNPVRFIDPYGLDSIDAVALKTAAENAVQFVTDTYGSSAAYCNQGVNHAFEELTESKELAGKNANSMVDQLDVSNNFTKVNQSEVQDLANDGVIVIAGKKENSGSGHVALAVPGEEVSANKERWGGSAPVGMDTGKDKRWSSNGMNYSWKSNEGVNFYKYTGTTIGADNNTYSGGTLPSIIVSAPARQLPSLPMSYVKL